MNALVTYLSQDFLGGPKVVKHAWVVNFQKGGTMFFVAALMIAYGNFSDAAWVYLALHGTYGVCWILKDLAFGDPRWQVRVTFGGALVSFLLVLGPYWLAPFLLVSDVLGPRPEPSMALLAFAIALHTLGLVIMVAADAQKYYTLKLRPGLIDTGMFKHIRHPNYLGEMMLYGAYAVIVGHWIPWAVLAWVWTALFLTNILMKEASLSRHPGWAEYKARTGLLWPWPFAARPSRSSADAAAVSPGR